MKKLTITILVLVFLLFAPIKVHAATLFQDDFTDASYTFLTAHNLSWANVVHDSPPDFIESNQAIIPSWTYLKGFSAQTDQCVSYDLNFDTISSASYFETGLRVNDSLLTGSGLTAGMRTYVGTSGFIVDTLSPFQHIVDHQYGQTYSGWHAVSICLLGSTYTFKIDSTTIFTRINNITSSAGGLFLNGENYNVAIDNLVYSGVLPNARPVINPFSNVTLNEGDTYSNHI